MYNRHIGHNTLLRTSVSFYLTYYATNRSWLHKIVYRRSPVQRAKPQTWMLYDVRLQFEERMWGIVFRECPKVLCVCIGNPFTV